MVIITCLLVFKNNDISITNKTNINYDNYNTLEYIGYLNIPKIAMNLGFYDYDNPLNNVEYNIEFINTGIDETYLIAAHSGVGQKAYFNDLAKLSIDDDIYLELYDKALHYKIIDITRTPKNGSINISKSSGFLYLTTCDQALKGYQLTIIATIIL